MKKEKNQYLGVYLKGLLMGICDLIPGISGGTIAFITGIYERFINSVKNITPKNYFNLLISILKFNKKEIKDYMIKFDTIFLSVLFIGIITAIISGANLISYLLENHKTLLLSFFVGLILASSITIQKHIQNHNKKNILFGLIGFLFGFSLFFIVPQNISEPSIFYLFIGGFIAICALFLPGISGSFILLIMGIYEYVINLVKNITENFIYLIPFGLGAISGMYVISRIVSWLFKKDKSKTLYILLGIVLGTLIIPLNLAYESSNYFSEINILIGSILLFIIGFLSGYYLEKKIIKKNHNSSFSK